MLLAHTGHWLVNVLYAVPIVVVVGVILRDRWASRRGLDRRDARE